MQLDNHSHKEHTLKLQQISKEEILNINFNYDISRNLVISTRSRLLEREVTPTERKISYKKKAQLRAAFYWLNMYQSEEQLDNTSHFGNYKGFLEAFYHLCQIDAFMEARKILFIPLKTPNNKALHEQLGILGYYQEQIQLYKSLLYKQEQEFDCFLLNNLGKSYYNLGQFNSAIQSYEQQITLSRKIKNLQYEGKALGGLGEVYNWSSFLNAKKAKNCFQQQLKTAIDINDSYLQSLALLGLANNCLTEKPHQSLYLCKKALKIRLEIDDEEIKNKILLTLADIYSFTNKSKLAIPILIEQLNISHNTGDREKQLLASSLLSRSYMFVGEHDKAISFINESLKINQSIGNLFRECDLLNCLGGIYCRLENYTKALEYLQKCINIAEQIGEKNMRCFAYANSCYCYTSLSNFLEAKSCYEKGIKFAYELKRRRTIAILEIVWANTLWKQGKYIQAFNIAIKSLLVLQPWQMEDGMFLLKKAIALVNNLLLDIWQKIKQ